MTKTVAATVAAASKSEVAQRRQRQRQRQRQRRLGLGVEQPTMNTWQEHPTRPGTRNRAPNPDSRLLPGRTTTV